MKSLTFHRPSLPNILLSKCIDRARPSKFILIRVSSSNLHIYFLKSYYVASFPNERKESFSTEFEQGNIAARRWILKRTRYDKVAHACMYIRTRINRNANVADTATWKMRAERRTERERGNRALPSTRLTFPMIVIGSTAKSEGINYPCGFPPLSEQRDSTERRRIRMYPEYVREPGENGLTCTIAGFRVILINYSETGMYVYNNKVA